MNRLPAFVLPAAAAVAAVPIALWPESGLAHVSYMVAFSALVVVSWLGVRQARKPVAAAQALIAGALSIYLSGDIFYDIVTAVVGSPGAISASDFLWVTGNVLLAGGVIRMSSLRAPGRLREGLLDALAMTTVVATLFWEFLVGPGLVDGLSPTASTFAIVYPLCDVALFAAVAVLVLSPGRRTGATGYLVAAIAVTLIGDTAISVCTRFAPNFDNSRLDSLLLIGNALIVAALWHPHAGQLTDGGQADDQRLHPARVAFLGLALLVIPVMGYVRPATTRAEHAYLLVAMAALTGIVLARLLFMVRDQERIRAALALRATHDQLTGLANRSELHLRVAAAIRQRVPGADGPAILFLDLDGFKSVNDKYGHAAGDHVLVEVAGRLRATVRSGDIVARLGGDEFVVMTADSTSAQQLTDRLHAVAHDPVRHDGVDLQIGFSIGSASAGALTDPTSDSLLAAADLAMYRAKTANRVRVAAFAPEPA